MGAFAIITDDLFGESASVLIDLTSPLCDALRIAVGSSSHLYAVCVSTLIIYDVAITYQNIVFATSLGVFVSFMPTDVVGMYACIYVCICMYMYV